MHFQTNLEHFYADIEPQHEFNWQMDRKLCQLVRIIWGNISKRTFIQPINNLRNRFVKTMQFNINQ